MVHLCNLESRVFKLKVSGPVWDVNWQEVAQGTLFIISTRHATLSAATVVLHRASEHAE